MDTSDLQPGFAAGVRSGRQTRATEPPPCQDWLHGRTAGGGQAVLGGRPRAGGDQHCWKGGFPGECGSV